MSNHKTVLCKFFERTAQCPSGEQCRFAHGKSELRSAPDPAFVEQQQTKQMPQNAKTKLCERYLHSDGCKYGSKCWFAHGEHELRHPETSRQEDMRGSVMEHALNILQSAGGEMRLAQFYSKLYAACHFSKEHVQQRGGPKQWAAETFRTDYTGGMGYESVRLPTVHEYVNDLEQLLTLEGRQCELSAFDKIRVPPPLGLSSVKDVLEANTDRFTLEQPHGTGWTVRLAWGREANTQQGSVAAPVPELEDISSFPALALSDMSGVGSNENDGGSQAQGDQRDQLMPTMSALFNSAAAASSTSQTSYPDINRASDPEASIDIPAASRVKRQLSELSASEVEELLCLLNFSQYAASFTKWNVSGADLAEEQLSDEHLKEIGVGLGLHRVRLLRMLRGFREFGVPDDKSPCSDLCVICLEGEKDHLVIGCGHKIMCKACADCFNQTSLVHGSDEEPVPVKYCPMCRCPALGVQRVQEV